MNEVEKMYRNCNIKKYRLLDRDHKLKWVYPQFTAEKQLELIKWMALTRPVTINKFIDGWNIEGSVRNNKQYANFENAISGYINSIYPFLDERQRAEIKEVLE